MAIQVMLSDPLVEVRGWPLELDRLGEYTLRKRKDPEQLRLERAIAKDKYPDGTGPHVSQFSFTRKTVIQTVFENGTAVARFLPGLWPRVKKALEERGEPFDIIDKRNMDIRPKLDYSAFKGVEFRPTQDLAIAAIACSDCGIIETSTAYGKSFIISLLCKAYPTLNIVVTTSSTQVVGTMYSYLCKVIPGDVGVLYAGRDTTQGKRVICTTLKSLPNIKPDNVHLIFVDECHALGDGVAAQDLMKFCWARKFGFSASPIRNDGSAIVMESLLGPTILKMTYKEAVDAKMVTPMNYAMLPCTKAPAPALNPAAPDVIKRRWSYWRNDARNAMVKRFVLELKARYNGQILIFVSTLEQAICLHMQLPWFKVAYYGKADFTELARKFQKEKYPHLDIQTYKMAPKQLDIMRKAYEKGTLRYVICTPTWRQGVNMIHLACIIRCDGDVSGISAIQIPGRAARLDKGKTESYLVDFSDTFSPWAMGRAQAREKEYQEQGWKCVTYKEAIDGLCRQAENDDEHADG